MVAEKGARGLLHPQTQPACRLGSSREAAAPPYRQVLGRRASESSDGVPPSLAGIGYECPCSLPSLVASPVIVFEGTLYRV